VLDAKLRKRVIDEGLMPYLEDTQDAWSLAGSGEYRAPKARAEGGSAQLQLLGALAASVGEA